MQNAKCVKYNLLFQKKNLNKSMIEKWNVKYVYATEK